MKLFESLKLQLNDFFFNEAPNKTIVFTFGRFNPPTIGHQFLIDKILSLSRTLHADYRVYVTATQDSKKNPLELSQKLHYLKLMFPNKNIIGVTPQTNTMAKVLENLNTQYNKAILVVGSDRVFDFQKLFDAMNGKDVQFDELKVVSAGERDPDSNDVSGMSATKLRMAASAGDFNTFHAGVAHLLSKDNAFKMFNDVRHGLGLTPIQESRFMKNNSKLFSFKNYIKLNKLAEARLVEDIDTPGKLKMLLSQILNIASSDIVDLQQTVNFALLKLKTMNHNPSIFKLANQLVNISKALAIPVDANNIPTPMDNKNNTNYQNNPSLVGVSDYEAKPAAPNTLNKTAISSVGHTISPTDTEQVRRRKVMYTMSTTE